MKTPDRSPGLALVEYAFGLTICLFFITGIVDFGRAFYTYNFVANTAREGARHASIPTYSSSDIVTYATSRSGVNGISVSVVNRGTSANAADPAVIQASATITPITPFIGAITGGPVTLTARSTMIVEK